MKRFVKHFYSYHGEKTEEEQINEYAEKYNLKIITLTALYGNGIYVLFEECEKKAIKSCVNCDNQYSKECQDCITSIDCNSPYYNSPSHWKSRESEDKE